MGYIMLRMGCDGSLDMDILHEYSLVDAYEGSTNIIKPSFFFRDERLSLANREFFQSPNFAVHVGFVQINMTNTHER